MPVTYSIDADRKLLHTICSGPVDLRQVVAHFQALRDDPACAARLDVLLDVSETESAPESAELGTVVAEVAAVRQKVQFGMCAIVATRDSMFGMMRMFEVFASRYFRAIRVFREVGEAKAWLASPLDPGNPSSPFHLS
jgi:hypothetical protein